MRFALILLLIPSALGSPIITELHPEPDGGREFIEIYNPQDAPYSLTGHAIADAAGNTFQFEDQVLGPRERMVVWGGGEATAEGPAWSRATVWNNGGDTAFLLNNQTVLDQLNYGTDHPAPGLGMSLYLDGTWRTGAPTPGLAPGQVASSAQVSVENVAPTIQLDAPLAALPGESVRVQLAVADANGDVLAWHLSMNGQRIGEGIASAEVTLNAPAQGPARLVATVTDGVHIVTTEVSIQIRLPGLQITSPPVEFPSLVPGALNVTALTPMVLHNDGDVAVTPLIDVSDFRGPAQFAPSGLLLVVQGEAMPYLGPLTPLPVIAPGESMEVWMRFASVPSPLPAGDYGTSFTVIA